MCDCQNQNNTSFVAGASNQYYQQEIILPEDCEYNEEILRNWKDLVLAAEINKLSQIGKNKWIGIIQSAINYPDNYCYYSKELAQFQQQVLPTII